MVLPKSSKTSSAVFRPLEKNWCISKGEVNKIRFEWNIQQFELLTANRIYQSTEFQEEEGSLKWRYLELSTNGVSVFVKLIDKCNPSTDKRRIKMSILNKKGEEVVQLKNTIGWSYEISKQIAYDSLLSDGSLTIWCEIKKRMDKHSESNNDDIVAIPKSYRPQCVANQLDTRMKRLFEDMKFSDVTLSVHGRQFQAHKCILTSSSKVFSAMFEHQTKETLSNHVEIEDIQPEVFRELLRFIYTGRSTLEVMETMAAKLLVAADKYLLDKLKSECEVHLLRQMSADNCMELLLLVSDQILSADNLKQGAIDFLRRFPGEVMATDGWKKAKQEYPNHQVWSLILEIVEKIHRH